MVLDDFMLFYARHGLFNPLRKSCYRKFCRRNRGRQFVAPTRYGTLMKTVIGDSVDNEIFVKGYFEYGTSMIMEQLARRSRSLVDVGCNIGYYSCLFGKSNPSADIFSIDPNPQMIERTRENIRLNQIVHSYTFNCGVASEKAVLKFYLPIRRHSLGSFLPPAKESEPVNEFDVEVRPLGEIVPLEDIEKGVLKIDAEGFELKILSGLTAADAGKFDAVIFEFASNNLKDAENDGQDIFRIPWFEEFNIYTIASTGELTPFEYRGGRQVQPQYMHGEKRDAVESGNGLRIG